MRKRSQHLGGLANWLGLVRTARVIGDGVEYTPPTPNTLVPGSRRYGLAVIEALGTSPLHPDVYAQMLAQGYADACPATVAMLCQIALDEAIWPPETRQTLGADVRDLARNASQVLRPHGTSLTEALRQNVLDHNRRYYDEAALLDSLRSGTPIELATSAKRAFHDAERHRAPEAAEKQRKSWWARAQVELPDWESAAYQWVDAQAPPSQDAHDWLRQYGQWSLLAGFPMLAYTVLLTLWEHRRDLEVQWLLIDMCLDYFGLEPAKRYLKAGEEPSDDDDRSWDTYRAVHARVALADQDLDTMRDVLKPVSERVATNPIDAAKRFPRCAVMLIELAMARDDSLTEVHQQMGLQALLEENAWPTANRMMIGLTLALTLPHKKTANAFALLEEASSRMPADVSFWTGSADAVEMFRSGREEFLDALAKHLLKNPFVKDFWELYADSCRQRRLAEAIHADLEEADDWAAPRSRPRARLARAAASTRREAVLSWTGPPTWAQATPLDPEPELPPWALEHLDREDLADADPSLLFAALQQAPASTRVVETLWSLGFFHRQPLIGSLAANELMSIRVWGTELSEMLEPWADRGGRLLRADQGAEAVMSSLVNVYGEVSEEAAGSHPHLETWRAAAAAKRAALEDREATAELEAAVEEHGDLEAALLLAQLGGQPQDTGAVQQSLFNLRVAGLLETIAWVAERLVRQTHNPDYLFFAVDALVELERYHGASTLVSRLAGEVGEDGWSDRPQAARARVLLAHGQAEEARAQLAEVAQHLADHAPAETADAWTNSALVLGAATMDAEGTLAGHDDLYEAVFACQPHARELPFARAVLAQAIAIQMLEVDEPFRALDGVRRSILDMPGELRLYRRVWTLFQKAGAERELRALLESHVASVWPLERAWTTLREIGAPSV